MRTQKTATTATRLSPLANGASRERDPPRRLGLAAGDDHAAQRHRPTPANGCNGEICGSGTCGRSQRGHHGRRYHSRHPCCRHPIDGPTSRTSDRPTGEALPRRGLRHAAAALTSAASATARGRPPTPCLSPGPAQRVSPAPGMRAADLRDRHAPPMVTFHETKGQEGGGGGGTASRRPTQTAGRPTIPAGRQTISPPHPPPPPIHSHAPPPLRVPPTTTAQDAGCSAAGRAGAAARPDAAGSARARTRGRPPFPGRRRGGASRPAAPAAPRAGVRGEGAGRAVAVGRGAAGTAGKSSPSI